MSPESRVGFVLVLAAVGALTAGMVAMIVLGDGEADAILQGGARELPEPRTGYIPFYHPKILPRYAVRASGQEVRARFVVFRQAGENRGMGFEVEDPLRIARRGLILSEEALEIYDRLDGRPLEEILREITAGMDPKGAELWRKRAGDLVRALDENLLLDNDRFRAEVLRRIAQFRDSDVREPSALNKLDRQEIDSRLRRVEGPAPRALLVPHIDYRRGADVYAAGYSTWYGRRRPDRIVVLGTSHALGAHYFALTRKAFRTSLGLVPCDTGFVDRLSSTSKHPLFVDEFLHRDEHSIELQLPWLQALFGNAPIVPVLCGSLATVRQSSPQQEPEIEDFIASLAAAVRESSGETLFVAAADLSHMGDYFGDSGLPGPEVEAADRAFLGFATALDAEAVFQGIRRDDNPRRICGGAPMYVLLRVLATTGGTGGRLLEYRQCVDLGGRRMVSVAAAAFD